jgi:hypothetical protein
MEPRRRRLASDLRRSIAHHQPGGTRALPAMRQRVLPGLFAAPLSEMRQGREGIRRFRELKPFEPGSLLDRLPFAGFASEFHHFG